MKTYLYFGGIQYQTDGIESYTHVVMLALNKEPFRPVTPTKEEFAAMDREKREELKSLDHANKAAFAHWEVRGKFSLRPGVWVAGEEEVQQPPPRGYATPLGLAAPATPRVVPAARRDAFDQFRLPLSTSTGWV